MQCNHVIHPYLVIVSCSNDKFLLTISSVYFRLFKVRCDNSNASWIRHCKKVTLFLAAIECQENTFISLPCHWHCHCIPVFYVSGNYRKFSEQNFHCDHMWIYFCFVENFLVCFPKTQRKILSLDWWKIEFIVRWFAIICAISFTYFWRSCHRYKSNDPKSTYSDNISHNFHPLVLFLCCRGKKVMGKQKCCLLAEFSTYLVVPIRLR